MVFCFYLGIFISAGFVGLVTLLVGVVADCYMFVHCFLIVLL